MGVSLWYPRFSLPNAPELEWPVDIAAVEPVEVNNSMEVDQSASTAETSASLSHIKSLIGVSEETVDAVPESKTVPVAAGDAITVNASKTDNEIVPPFGFLFFRYSLGLSVVVSVQDSEPLSSVEMRFIDAVMRYLGVPTKPEFNHRVAWPFVKQSTQFSTRAFFEDSMKALFHKQAVGFGVNTFLLFGQRLSNELSELLGGLSSDGQSMRVISSPELPELLTSADAKRSLWKQLSPLKTL